MTFVVARVMAAVGVAFLVATPVSLVWYRWNTAASWLFVGLALLAMSRTEARRVRRARRREGIVRELGWPS